jgi:hypothetical protein
VLLEASGASLTLSISVLTGSTLRTDTDTVTDLDTALSFGTDADGSADELVADTTGVVGRPL